MKTKRIMVGILISIFLLGLLSSCAIDRKCPAYSQTPVEAAPASYLSEIV